MSDVLKLSYDLISITILENLEHYRLKHKVLLLRRYIMVIELSGVQFGLKSYM